MYRNPHSLPLPPITPHPVPPVIPPAPPKPVAKAYGRFQRSSYSGIDAVPFDPLSAARPVEPPFAPGAFMRPAPAPGPVTQIPAGLAGPIFGAPGWHFGPPVHAAVRSGYNTSKIDWTKVAQAQAQYGNAGQAAAGGIAAGLLLLGLAIPVGSSIAFGRKYGATGYIWGFFVPGAIMAGIGALTRFGKSDTTASK